MINIFVTYRCNLACPYCFARDMKGEFPYDMGEEAFSALLDWLVCGSIQPVVVIVLHYLTAKVLCPRGFVNPPDVPPSQLVRNDSL